MCCCGVGRVVAFRRRVLDRFGGCPECGHVTGLANIGRSHWLYCGYHGTKWFAGYGLFRPSERESPSLWLANARLLADFREVRPLEWRWVRPGATSECADPDLERLIGT